MSYDTNALSMSDLSQLFNSVNGYHDSNNDGLQRDLLGWDLTEEASRTCPEVVASYIRWSFSVSLLMLVNAWQWFFGGVLLGRQSLLPAQVNQLYYYSIFFSYRSFLASQFKGVYTIAVEGGHQRSYFDWKRRRKALWADGATTPARIVVADTGRSGEHASTASWFYAVLKNSGLADDYPDVTAFAADTKFHAFFRQRYTYHLANMAQELFSLNEPDVPDLNQVLIDLWHGTTDAVEYLAEEFWASQHLKVATDVHLRLLEAYPHGSPYGLAQQLLLSGLHRHHRTTGLVEVLDAVAGPVFSACHDRQ